MNPSNYLQLGAYGDIISILPALWHEWKTTGYKPRVVVSEDYANLFDGISYVELRELDVRYHEYDKAMAQCSEMNIIPIQVFQANINPSTDSYVKDMWLRAGKIELFGRLPTIFDNRTFQREQSVVRQLVKSNKPVILCCMSGKSAPFPESHQTKLIEILNPFLDAFEIVDLGSIKAHRIYDVLGLMDMAAMLICTDSAMLHLSVASGVPTVALVNDIPSTWNASPRYRNQILRIGYTEFDKRKGEIAEAIKSRIA